MKLLRRVISYVEVGCESEEIMSVMEAARVLGMTNQVVVSLVDRGRLTELVDTEAPNPRRGRRYLLRAEVEELAERQRLAIRLAPPIVAE